MNLAFPRIAFLLLAGWFAILCQCGCNRVEEAHATDNREVAPVKDEPSDKAPKGDRFAEDRGAADVREAAFDGKRAMTYLQQICDLGPRISGSEGMKKQRELIRKHFNIEVVRFSFHPLGMVQVVDRIRNHALRKVSELENA